MPLTIPTPLKKGDIVGICTPSMPAYSINHEVFENGIRSIERQGFKVKLGFLTEKRSSQGYRSAGPKERADELMSLFTDKGVQCILTTIGGMNSNSLIPYLDFDLIKANPKIFCGYSDITSLHLSLLKYSELATFYGPGLMPHWSEYPNGIEESIKSFFDATARGTRVLRPFKSWSNHFRDWKTNDWKEIPRSWSENSGWKVLNKGAVEAEVIACNLNTLMSAAGTDYFPDLEGRVLLLEEMEAPLSKEERSLRQLQLMGVFEKLSGLIIGKPENLGKEEAPFGLDDLILEVVGKRSYPIIVNFDCSHTIPMHTIRQHSILKIDARDKQINQLEIL